MSLYLAETRARINRYLDALEDLARAVDVYLVMVHSGVEEGIQVHRRDVETKLERVREASQEGGEE